MAGKRLLAVLLDLSFLCSAVGCGDSRRCNAGQSCLVQHGPEYLYSSTRIRVSIPQSVLTIFQPDMTCLLSHIFLGSLNCEQYEPRSDCSQVFASKIKSYLKFT